MAFNILGRICRPLEDLIGLTASAQHLTTLPDQLRPLQGVKVIELEGYVPSAFCGMMLSDFGANVTVVSKVCSIFFF